MAIVSSFSQDREKSIGFIEAANGVGLLFGPIIGAFLYQLGGYKLPFFFFGGLYLLCYPVIAYVLVVSNKEMKALDASQARLSQSFPEGDKPFSIPLLQLLIRPRFTFGLIAQMNLLMGLQYLAPNLSVQLQSYGLGPTEIGFSYGIPAVLYALTCPFMYLLTKRFEKRGIMLTGFFIIALSMFLIGGGNILYFEKSPVGIISGLCLLGLSGGMVKIPVLPEMLESIEEDKPFNGSYDRDKLENVISGLFVGFQSLGEILGPVMSSLITQNAGFKVS